MSLRASVSQTADSPACTVIVCTRNRPEQLGKCLNAISKSTHRNFELLVVDNAPSDERTKEVAARKNARYVIEPVTGLSRARNHGARCSLTEIIAYLDDDCVPEPDWLTRLVSRFDDPHVMAVTGRILPIKSLSNSDCVNSWSQFISIRGEEPIELDRETPNWFEIANFGGIGDGGNMAFRRSVFEEWEGFDERLGRGAPISASEEHHAFFSIVKRGFRIVYEPSAVVRHPFPVTEGDTYLFRLKNLKTATGYATLLFVEEPEFRRQLVKFLQNAVKGEPRTWGGNMSGRALRQIPFWRVLPAVISGPLNYLRAGSVMKVKR